MRHSFALEWKWLDSVIHCNYRNCIRARGLFSYTSACCNSKIKPICRFDISINDNCNPPTNFNLGEIRTRRRRAIVLTRIPISPRNLICATFEIDCPPALCALSRRAESRKSKVIDSSQNSGLLSGARWNRAVTLLLLPSKLVRARSARAPE